MAYGAIQQPSSRIAANTSCDAAHSADDARLPSDKCHFTQGCLSGQRFTIRAVDMVSKSSKPVAFAVCAELKVSSCNKLFAFIASS